VEIAKFYLEILKGETPADLMSIDADRLLAVAELLGQYFGPDKNAAWRPLGGIVDGEWIPELPVDHLFSHRIDEAGPKFEVMLGFAKDEWLLFRSNNETTKNGTNEDVLKVLAHVFDERAPAVLEAYRELNPTHSPGRLLSDIMSFEFCKYSTLEIACTLSAQGIPTYVLEFAYEMPGLGGALHAVRTGDVPFI
jgi:para-nitrobenzyl esterase